MLSGRSSTHQTELSNRFPVPCEIHHNPPNNSPASTPPRPASTMDIAASSIDHGERIWGEILERSLSSGSIHRLQRIERSGYPYNGSAGTDPARHFDTGKRNKGDLIWHM